MGPQRRHAFLAYRGHIHEHPGAGNGRFLGGLNNTFSSNRDTGLAASDKSGWAVPCGARRRHKVHHLTGERCLQGF